MAAGAIGSGEIFFWPACTAAYGPSTAWGYNAGCIAQVYQFLEAARWECATGESIDQGFERLIPHISYFFMFCSAIGTGIPGWAALCSTSLMYLFNLPLPMGIGHPAGWEGWCLINIALCLVFMLPSKVILTILKYVSYGACIALIALSYVVVVAVASPDVYYQYFMGMWNQMGWIPDPNSSILYRAYSPTGPLATPVVTTPAKLGITFTFFISSVSYAGSSPSSARTDSKRRRDQGVGMGAYMARVTGAFGKREDLDPSGYTCDFTIPENVKNFKAWHTSNGIDIWIIYTMATLLTAWAFCMGSYAILYPMHYVPTGITVGVVQGEMLRAVWGTAGFDLMMFIVWLTLWTTQLGNFDGGPRDICDIVYYKIPSIRKYASYRTIYWTWVACMTVICVAVVLSNTTSPTILIQLNAMISWIQAIPITVLEVWINQKLPKEVRTPTYNLIIMALIICFWVWLTVLWIPNQLHDWGYM